MWDEISRFDPSIPIERAWMPPSTWYTDAGVLELERRVVFQQSWQPACLVTAVTEPGSYVAGCFADVPWVIVRDADGALRGFHNVCSHKGREVVTGAGIADQLVCGYHAWSYRLDGTLRKAPRIGGIADFDVDEMGLKPLAVEAWGPWVFVNATTNPGSLRESVADLDAALEAGRWADLVFAGRKEWVINCNWKVFVDNYLDGGYHIPHMHPTLDAQLDMKSYRTEVFEQYSVQRSDAAAGDDERLELSPQARIGGGALYAWLFPNFMVNRYGPCMDSNLVHPLGVDRCRVVYEFFFDDSLAGARDFIEESIAQADVTQREDIEICESVQVGLRSPAYDRGRYAPRVEVGEFHFHQLLAARFAAGRPGDSAP